jgi:hypothetical protein
MDLMYRCITEISFKQVTGGRNQSFSFDFVNSFEVTNTWAELTNTAKITFPKNIYVRDAQNNLVPLTGTNTANQVSQLFQRGDQVSISYGYYTYDTNGNEAKVLTQIFAGYISKVSSKKPIQLECEDNMWVLKQIPCSPQVWPGSQPLETLFKNLLAGTNFTVNMLTQTTLGDITIQNESVAQLLARLRKDYNMEAYFGTKPTKPPLAAAPYGNELRIGSWVYIDSEATQSKFVFQQNIISDELEFQFKEDLKLSAVVNSLNTVNSSDTNQQGQTKTQKGRVSVLVYPDPGGDGFVYDVKQNGVEFPSNEEGERRTLFFNGITDPQVLADNGAHELNKYYYSGFKGRFTTFAIPYVKMGDNVMITDNLMPDRNGLYRVRGVTYIGGVNGHRQIIELDYYIPISSS